MNLFLAIVYNNKTINHPAISQAGQVTFDVDHPQLDPNTMYLNVDTDPNQAGVKDFLKKAKINRFPAIVFVEKESNGKQKVVTKITRNINYKRIKKIILDIISGKYTGHSTEEPGETGAESMGLPFGLNLLNIKLPKIAWIALALYSGKKTLDSTSTLGQVGYGSLTAYSIYQIKK